MKKLSAAAAALLAASTTLASEATGTEGVSQMNITGAQFAMMVGALAGLGVVIWLVVKVTNK